MAVRLGRTVCVCCLVDVVAVGRGGGARLLPPTIPGFAPSAEDEVLAASTFRGRAGSSTGRYRRYP